MQAPQDCHNMTELRAAIDALDARIVGLMAARVGYIDRAIELKPAEAMPARIEARVEEVVARVRASALAQGCDPDLAEAMWRLMIDWSITREEGVLGR